jgi:hypothetical protein
MGGYVPRVTTPQDIQDTTQDARFVPLKITCELMAPAILDMNGCHLDGLLSWAAATRYFEREGIDPLHTNPNLMDWPDDFELPLARWIMPLTVAPVGADDRLYAPGTRDVWGWCASQVVTEWLARERLAFRGKSPTDEILRLTDAKSVNIASGRFKSIDLAHEARHAKTLTWYARGDAAAVRDLLGDIVGVGKKHNVGPGRVRCSLEGVPQWCVEEVEDDWSVMAQDAPMRNLPWSPALGIGRFGGVRAPYWHRSRHILIGGPYDP